MTGFDPEKVTFFARTNARGQDVPFGIKAKDRQRHMYVIGKTGMGKSTLLENMAAQDILNGEGMCFIDPHGSAIEVLLEYIPEERLDDVVYFAPFDMHNPIAFNIMEDVGADTRHLVVSGLMSTFKKIWEDAWSARMEYILTNALLALIEYPNTTLLSVNRMLADKTYRDKVIENVKDPAVKAYWVDEFNNYTERFAAEALPAIQNKIGQFTGNPLIRNIIGQPKSSFDVRKMMDEKKILLVNLSKGLVGETNADLLGSMLITKIYLAAMSRAELPPAQMKLMPNFYFYVDEFQSFANSTFANILSEARKYHLNLIIAHQYVAQMEEKIRDAVFGNVGTTVTFRVGPFDAETLEPIFSPPFMAPDLVNLGAYQVYLTLMIDGAGSQPFSASTLPPVKTPDKSHKHMVIKRSQENYCCTREEAEQLVTNLHTPDDRVEASEKGEGANHGGFTKPSAFFKVGKDKEFVKQKERLKDGGSRLKGPAQTPPGGGANKAPAGKTDQRQSDSKPASDRRSSDNKPTSDRRPSENKSNQQQSSRKPVEKQSEKTPEDFKKIISGMVKKEPAKKQDSKKDQKAEVGSSGHRMDLQAALAGLGVEEKSEKSPEKITSTQTDQKKSAPVKSTESKPPAPPGKSRSQNTQKKAVSTDSHQSQKEKDSSRDKQGRQSHKKPPVEQSVRKAETESKNKKGSEKKQHTSPDVVLANLKQRLENTQTKSISEKPTQERVVAVSRKDVQPEKEQKPENKQVEKRHISNELIKPKETESQEKQDRRHESLKKFSARPSESVAPVMSSVSVKEPVSVRRVTVERRPQIPVMTQPSSPPASVAGQENSTSPTVSSIRPSFTPATVSTGPSVHTVKKILQHSGNERLPGMK